VLNLRTTVWAVPVVHTGEMTRAYIFLDIAHLDFFANCMCFHPHLWGRKSSYSVWSVRERFSLDHWTSVRTLPVLEVMMKHIQVLKCV
jgi:hypothetical protein